MEGLILDRKTEILIIGGGYSGSILFEILRSKGLEVLIADSKLESEIEVFSKLEVFDSHYSEFIEEYKEILKHKPEILQTTIFKTVKNEKWLAESIEHRIEADEVFVCTGCYDKRPFSCKIFGMRPAGIFSIQNALELLAKGYRIGRRVLVFGHSKQRIFEVVEECLRKLKYDCELVVGDQAEVLGRERVEGVLVDGEKFSCDTLVYFCGRESFNPFNLEGIKAGNINTKCYDYDRVKKDVLKAAKGL